MNWPFLVLPYQASPWRWKTLESRLTHTMPGDGGTWAVIEEGLAGVVRPPGAGAALGAGAGAGAGAALGAGAGADEAPAVTIGVMVVMVFAGTPTRERSAAEV